MARKKQGGLMDPGALVFHTKRLEDGQPVRYRLVRPSDRLLIRRFLERLVASANHTKPAQAARDVKATVYQLVHYDPRSRLAICATITTGSTEHLVGLGDVTVRGQIAEARLAVDNEYRGLGIGSSMVDSMAHLAVQREATCLVSEPDPGMRSLLARLGKPAQKKVDGRDVVSVDLPPLARAA